MKTHSIDFIRELNTFQKSLGLPKPTFRHHFSKCKFYTVIMMPMQPSGDHSAFGSGEGFNTRRAANEEAALKAIKALSEYHSVAYRDINHDELTAERKEKMVALTSMKEFMDEKDVLQQENMELRDAYKTVEKRYLTMEYVKKKIGQ